MRKSKDSRRDSATGKGHQEDHPLVVVLKFKQAVIKQIQTAEQGYDSFPNFILKGVNDDENPSDDTGDGKTKSDDGE